MSAGDVGQYLALRSRAICLLQKLGNECTPPSTSSWTPSSRARTCMAPRHYSRSPPSWAATRPWPRARPSSRPSLAEQEFHFGGLPLGRYLYRPTNKVMPPTAREAVMLLDNAIVDFINPVHVLEYHHVLLGASPVCFPADPSQAKVRVGVSFKTDTHLGTVAIVSVRHNAVAAALTAMSKLAPKVRRYQYDAVFFLLPPNHMTSLPDCTWTLGRLEYALSGEYRGTATLTDAMNKAGKPFWRLHGRRDKMLTLTVIGNDRHVQLPTIAALIGLEQAPKSKGWTHHGTAVAETRDHSPVGGTWAVWVSQLVRTT
ncbi:hypothetical protein BC828DRAFT_122896 [Blastocladiella britannica]|nr:hypothetical protein BC828DRAFT_122896 [Blastocladiella britannica]